MRLMMANKAVSPYQEVSSCHQDSVMMCEPVPGLAREARELTCSWGSERAVWRKLPENPPVSS